MTAASGSTNTPFQLSKPMLIGGHPALDFVNSVVASDAGPVDWMRDGQSFLQWLLLSHAVPAAIQAAAQGFSAQQLNRAAAEARALREEFRELLFRWSVAGAHGVLPADVELLNAHLARGKLLQSVSCAADGVEFRVERDPSHPSAITAELAAACADLLAHARFEQVRKCENPQCTLWFSDTKRGPKRRWCSMAICGNRTKVAAHRARVRSDASGS